MNQQLYQITERYQNILALLDDPELAENQDVLSALDDIEDEFDHKVEQTVFIMRTLESEIDPIEAEIKRLQAMKKTKQNNIDRIKDRLKANFKATGIDKVKCPLFTVSYREAENNAVELDEEIFLANNLNEDFINVKITPNKTAIKAALKEEQEIIGAKLVNSQVLTIR